MTPVLIETTAAATIAWTLVAMLKRALPNAPTWIVVAVALIAGQVAAFLLAAQSSPTWTQAVVAQVVTQGILAAATAAGISQTDQSAERARNT